MPLLVDLPIVNSLLSVSLVATSAVFYLLLRRGKDRGTSYLAISSLGAALWVGAMIAFVNLDVRNPFLIHATRALYFAGVIVITMFFYFCYRFTLKKKDGGIIWHIIIRFITPTLFVLFAVSSLLTSFIIESVDTEKTVWFGGGYTTYSLYLIFWIMMAYWLLLRKAITTLPKTIERRQLNYLMFGTSISVFSGLLFDIILPWAGNFDFYWLGPVIVMWYSIAITYAIFKHHLFNIKVITTELFTGLLLIILLINAVLSESTSQLALNLSIFIGALIVGILLIRSVLLEVKTRERLENLTLELEKVNIELKKADVAKTEFMSMASHQLRTPLTAIKGYISLALEGHYGPLPEKLTKVLNNVYQSNERLVKLVQDLLTISRIEMGKLVLEKEPTQLEELTKSSLEEMRIAAENKNLKLELKIPEKPLPKINIDPLKIRQAVLNLIDNAIKYTSEGRILIEVKQAGDKAFILVKDTGIGLEKGERERIFESFSRGRAGVSLFIEGTGLGLHVAQRFVVLHGGKIKASSPGLGQGSVFVIELPIKTNR